MNDEERTVEVRVKAGKANRPISRLPDGKTVLFSDVDPKSASIKPGDVVTGVIVHSAEGYVIVRPSKIESTYFEFECSAKLMFDNEYNAILFLDKDVNKSIEFYVNQEFQVRAVLLNEK